MDNETKTLILFCVGLLGGSCATLPFIPTLLRFLDKLWDKYHKE